MDTIDPLVLRELFSRMVFSLETEPSLSMEIIAFWLWIEGNGHFGFLRRINSFDDQHLSRIVGVGKEFFEILHRQPNSSNAGLVPNNNFRQAAIQGIVFYLNAVCYKILTDIREKADEMIKACRMKVSPGMNDHVLNLRNASSAQLCTSYGESSSTSGNIGPPILKNMMEPEVATQSVSSFAKLPTTTGFPQQLHDGTSTSLGSNVQDSESPLSECIISSDYLLARPDNFPQRNLVDPNMKAVLSLQPSLQPHSNILQEERMLLVTFSKGCPLSEEEVFEFFMRKYGDVEGAIMEMPPDERPPLFAYVIFRSVGTLLNVLHGDENVKFMMRGKHFWARRFSLNKA